MQKQNPQRNVITQLLTIQTLAGFSQWLDIFLIFSVPAFAWHATPAQMALIAACLGLPGLLLGPFAGALLDRMDPRRAAWVGALLRSTLSGLIAVAPGFGIFAALVFLKGLANVLYWPAASILTQRVVGPAERISYFSSLSALDQIAKIVTPLMAGAATLAMGAQQLFVLSAAMTVACALLIARLPATSNVHEVPGQPAANIWASLVAGWKSFSGLASTLVCSIALGIGMSLALAIYDPHLASYLNAMHLDPGAFSLLVSATAGGAVFGAMGVRLLGSQWAPTRLLRAGIALFFAAITAAAVASVLHAELTDLALLAGIWFVSGLGYELFVIGSGVILLNLCPSHLLGRVATSARSLQMLAVVTGPLLGAWLIGLHSRNAPFVVSALLVGVLLLASGFCLGGCAGQIFRDRPPA